MVKGTALLRLMHLVSPSLPTGAFAYSQGLEWAIEEGWIKTKEDLKNWLKDVVRSSFPHVDIPVLKRMAAACAAGDEADLRRWCFLLLSFRETREMLMEEKARGIAMTRLLQGLAVPLSKEWEDTLNLSQLAGFSLAAVKWKIGLEAAATGCVWSWLENQVLAGIKTIPIGQTDGSRILLEMDETVTDAVKEGLETGDEDMGAANPAMAMASSLHETQYTRIYRS